jgi:hypothetical protein
MQQLDYPMNAIMEYSTIKNLLKRDFVCWNCHVGNRYYGLPVVLFETVVVVAIVVELVVFEGVGVVFEVPMPERVPVVILGFVAIPVVVSTERVIFPNPAEVFPDVRRLPFLKISTRRTCRVDPSSFSKVACTGPVAFSTR